jgi:hypothetical protein
MSPKMGFASVGTGAKKNPSGDWQIETELNFGCVFY